jgi:hypothetical protein
MTALELFEKLRPFLRVEILRHGWKISDGKVFPYRTGHMPFVFQDSRGRRHLGKLVWQPRWPAWKQPTFEQFCTWYSLDPEKNGDEESSCRVVKSFCPLGDACSQAEVPHTHDPGEVSGVEMLVSPLEWYREKLLKESQDRLVRMGYDLDELDRDNPFNSWMNDYVEDEDNEKS